jgi:hypothetical protein
MDTVYCIKVAYKERRNSFGEHCCRGPCSHMKKEETDLASIAAADNAVVIFRI